MSLRRFIACLFTIIILGTGSAFAADDQYLQIRVFFDSKQDWLGLQSLPLDIVKRTDQYLETIADSSLLEELLARGLRVEVVHDDLVAYFQKRMGPLKDMGGYMTLSEINATLDSLALANPLLVDKISIGASIQGRTVWATKISDNVRTNEDEPELLFTAAIHAREVITPLVAINVMRHLLENYGTDSAATSLVDNREIWFVIPVNPDGYYYNEVTNPAGGGMWRKNRRNNGDGSFGVDLNRNYGYQWGCDDDGSSPETGDPTYRGIAPFSEPETQALRDFIEANEFVATVYFHSYSNLVLWPWGYDYLTTPDNGLFSIMGDSMAAFNGYAPQPCYELYLANGISDDWGYGEQTSKNMNLAFTIEIGSDDDNFWPPEERIDQLVSENLEPALFLMRVADNPYRLLAPSAPIAQVADSVDSAAYEVTWSHSDPLNPAVAYELTELSGLARITDAANDFDNWTNNGFSLSTTRRHSLPTSFHSGAASYSVTYMDLAEPLQVQAADSLRFWTYYNIESGYDYAYVELSTDGGLNYAPIPGSITTNANPNGYNRGDGITGHSGNWIQASFDLSAYAGQSVLIRFSYYTDSYLTYDGFFVDDIYPVEIYQNEQIVDPDLSDTSFAFTDHAVGDYYYKVRARDAQGQWSGFSSIVGTTVWQLEYICVDADGDGFGDPGHPENHCAVDNCPSQFNPDQADGDGDGLGDLCDACPSDSVNDADADGICGDVDNCPDIANADQADANSDGTGNACCCAGMAGNIDGDELQSIDITDLVYLVTYMFGGGPVPGCPREADVNGDGAVADITDLVYLVDFMFQAGPAPAACPQ